jgi:cbb3-type cytochrome oxidase subunit 3
MFKQHLAGAIGVDVYLMISLFIFLAFFVGVVIRLFFYDKKEIDEMSRLPLSDTIDEDEITPVRLY